MNLGKCAKCAYDIREPAKVVPGVGVVHSRCAPKDFVQLPLVLSLVHGRSGILDTDPPRRRSM